MTSVPLRADSAHVMTEWIEAGIDAIGTGDSISNARLASAAPSCLRRLRLKARKPSARTFTPPEASTRSATVVPMPVTFTQPVWDADRFPGRHVARVGAQAGAREPAANVYELDPGAVGSPLHAHQANEELLLELAGTPSLRGPDGTQLLSAGAVVAFPRAEPGSHSLVHRSDAPVRYLVVSTTNRPDIVEYPDTGATLVVLEEQRLAYPQGADADQQRVVAEAMRAAADRGA